jgi:hypothetical protein
MYVSYLYGYILCKSYICGHVCKLLRCLIHNKQQRPLYVGFGDGIQPLLQVPYEVASEAYVYAVVGKLQLTSQLKVSLLLLCK